MVVVSLTEQPPLTYSVVSLMVSHWVPAALTEKETGKPRFVSPFQLPGTGTAEAFCAPDRDTVLVAIPFGDRANPVNVLVNSRTRTNINILIRYGSRRV